MQPLYRAAKQIIISFLKHANVRESPVARTFFDKVWSDHVIADRGDGTSLLQIDRLFLHDLSGSHALRQLEESGRKPPSPEQVFVVIDHTIDTAPGRGRSQSHLPAGGQMIESVRRRAPKFGFTFFDVDDPRQGIVHVVSPEQGIALPGMTLVCGDSHTCTVGGIGAVAWGIGSSEGEHVLATQTLSQAKPKTMRVNFEGDLQPGVYAKDMILHLIGTIGANGGIGYAVEFAGSAIRSLPVEGRLTICNMAIEFSAKYGFVPADDVTFEYLRGRPYAPQGDDWDGAVAYWRSLATEAGALFDHEVDIDCSAIRPQVTWGASPQQVVAIDGTIPSPAAAEGEARSLINRALDYMQLEPGTPIDGLSIQAAYIGSCTNARLSDLRAAAAVLKGRKVAPGLQAICVPGSARVKAAAEAEGIDSIFKAAGFEWHESGCALCANLGNERLADLRVISTTNRNFEGRQGPRTRTHLASPATVAASAIAGCIADARKFA